MKYDWERALAVGVNLARENIRRGDEMKETDVAWALLVDAAQTSKQSYKAPPRQDFPSKSTMPDAPDEITHWQRMAAYLRGDTKQLDAAGTTRPPMPSAAAVTRAEKVLWVWHHKVKGGIKHKQAVFLLAAGVPMRFITSQTGLHRGRLYNQRQLMMLDMLEAIGRAA